MESEDFLLTEVQILSTMSLFDIQSNNICLCVQILSTVQKNDRMLSTFAKVMLSLCGVGYIHLFNFSFVGIDQHLGRSSTICNTGDNIFILFLNECLLSKDIV